MLFVLLFFKTSNVCHNVIFCIHHCDQIPIFRRSCGIFLFMKSPKLKAWTFALTQVDKRDDDHVWWILAQ